MFKTTALIPSQLPPLTFMVDDIALPPRTLAKSLGVKEAELRGWIAAEQAPKPVLLALFWMTKWGRDATHTELHNTAREYAGHVAALRSEIDRLRLELARVCLHGNFGSANDPTQHAADAARWAEVANGASAVIVPFPQPAKLA